MRSTTRAKRARTARGRAIQALLAKKGLGIDKASTLAGVAPMTLRNLVFVDPPPRVLHDTAVKLHERLGIPMDLISPGNAA